MGEREGERQSRRKKAEEEGKGRKKECVHACLCVSVFIHSADTALMREQLTQIFYLKFIWGNVGKLTFNI